jgi:hypothetical protein
MANQVDALHCGIPQNAFVFRTTYLYHLRQKTIPRLQLGLRLWPSLQDTIHNPELERLLRYTQANDQLQFAPRHKRCWLTVQKVVTLECFLCFMSYTRIMDCS